MASFEDPILLVKRLFWKLLSLVVQNIFGRLRDFSARTFTGAWNDTKKKVITKTANFAYLKNKIELIDYKISCVANEYSKEADQFKASVKLVSTKIHITINHKVLCFYKMRFCKL